MKTKQSSMFAVFAMILFVMACTLCYIDTRMILPAFLLFASACCSVWLAVVLAMKEN